ncbi:coiled-coil domain-containing protein 55-domain containing protein [Boeremia exigua]|uniref:coiled-coil domain-containing protein 55-domain containing protein n=1 Tax=Boeremia exigua TaxID=749465 RepID=UPI001E8CE391|nr:coiled-coil domain-containing protein 55-domain containing protein [Boeremia exigua]KAH6625707.1 coiled-coil domain-containing protein 55-domain containing protein [Boeremia exigua]
MSFKFGLNVKNKLASGPAKPGLAKKKKLLLGDDEDPKGKGKAKADSNVQEISDFNFDATLASSSEPSKPAAPKPKKGEPPAPPTKKATAKADDPTTIGYSASALEAEQRALEAAKQDASLYDYDAAYDAIHARQAAVAAAAREDAAARKPKYIDALFSASEQRKKDQLRARDKLLAREREAEGDDFADKDAFVTGAYKAQQEEARRAEEEERVRLEEEERQKAKFGMQGFHKQMLLEQEQRHAEAMAYAAAAAAKGETLVVEEEKTDRQIAEEARRQGRTVTLNDAGEIADKRQLLSAGLNIVAPPKRASAAGATEKPAPSPLTHQPRAAKHAQRERQTAMVAEQIEAAAKRKADEDAEEAARVQRAAKSQKTAGEISSAKERYLQRKAEAARAKAEAAGK